MILPWLPLLSMLNAVPVPVARMIRSRLLISSRLGALQLQSQRSFISLIDSKSQFILAEATPSVSLLDSTTYRTGENPILGACKISLEFGVCPLSIQPFLSQTNDSDPHVLPEAQDVYFMKDMSEIKEYSTRGTVVNWPFLKFYAAVPLRTQDGQVIGMYSVTDSRKRDGLSAFEVQKMRELASVVS